MIGWHHWFSGHEFEQAPGDGEGQGSMVHCSPLGHRESDMTETEKQQQILLNQIIWVPLSYKIELKISDFYFHDPSIISFPV